MFKRFWDWLYWGKGGSPYASFERRILASMVDTLLLSLLLMPVFRWFLNPAAPVQQAMQQLLMQYQQGDLNQQDVKEEMWRYLLVEGGGLLFLTDLFYQVVVIGIVIVIFWFFRGATPGKMLLNMKIVDSRTGEKPSGFQWLVRYVGYILSVMPLMLGFVWIMWDKKRQGWHDKLAGTVVVLNSQKE